MKMSTTEIWPDFFLADFFHASKVSEYSNSEKFIIVSSFFSLFWVKSG